MRKFKAVIEIVIGKEKEQKLIAEEYSLSEYIFDELGWCRASFDDFNVVKLEEVNDNGS